MKKYQVVIKNKTFEIIQDDDGKFIIPEYIKKQEQFGTALKPSFEPIIVARKPFKGSLVDNVIEYGVGGINIDECRVELNGDKKNTGGCKTREDNVSHLKFRAGQTNKEDNSVGRFPANTILTYDETDYDEVCGGFPNTSGGSYRKVARKRTGFKISGSENNIQEANSPDNYGDSGSASRYFYCAKASKKDRDEGLDYFPTQEMKVTNQYEIPRDDGSIREIPYRKNTHPTVKPTLLMQYLVRLVTPKGGTILDPFMGSGSTGKAVMFENKERKADYNFIGIKKEKDYCNIAEARIRWAEEYKEKKENENQISFEDLEAKDEI